MKFLKTSITFISILLSVVYGFAANKYSILDGFGNPQNFSSSSAWSNTLDGSSCSCTPNTRDQIKISQNMILDINLTLGSNTGSLDIYASKSLTTLTYSLTVPSNTSLYVYGTLEVYDLTFSNGSYVYVSPSGKIIVHNNLTNNNNSDDIIIDGGVDVTGTFFNGNGGGITGNGEITASDFTGTGTTFGYTNNIIPDGATVSNGSLPINLLSFNAIYESGNVLINWTTNSEINNDFFTIEKSVDAVQFDQVANIDGAGNSNLVLNYSATDNEPYNGISYYRLKQTDFDGNYSFSNIVSVNNINTNNPFSFNLFPNPVSINENPSIIFSSYEPETEILVVVLNLLGQELYSKIVVTDFSGNSITAIDLENRLPSGTYLVIGTSLNQIYNKYLIIR